MKMSASAATSWVLQTRTLKLSSALAASKSIEENVRRRLIHPEMIEAQHYHSTISQKHIIDSSSYFHPCASHNRCLSEPRQMVLVEACNLNGTPHHALQRMQLESELNPFLSFRTTVAVRCCNSNIIPRHSLRHVRAKLCLAPDTLPCNTIMA
ncbi:hypothetical protein BKA64DRAFT_449101 [Cadophora sp. MPI-SDFR-AT-0126]|nr:hypothetical protein BKA64DRAFT_449101 [Leotiomycetes sp. MPI-SDFR-AT-0126]